MQKGLFALTALMLVALPACLDRLGCERKETPAPAAPAMPDLAPGLPELPNTTGAEESAPETM